MAQPFDADNLSLSGDAFPIVERVGVDRGYAAFSISTDGTLVYRGENSTGTTNLQLFDRSGKRLQVFDRAINPFNPSLAPDQNRIAVELRTGGLRADVWVIDLLRETLSRFTFDPGFDGGPLFSPNGQDIVFTSDRSGQGGLYLKSAAGTGAEELLVEGQGIVATGWSPDGNTLLYHLTDTVTNVDVWALPMTGDRKPYAVLNQRSTESLARFSPDGKWIVYTSNETGRSQIYVQTFPPSGGKWQVSVDGGTEAFWRSDGKEIVFSSVAGIMAVDVNTSSTFEAGIPREVFRISRLNQSRFTMSGDAQRFLFAQPPDSGDRPTITVVQNWTADIQR
jgi:Tol biopolymer transport system component